MCLPRMPIKLCTTPQPGYRDSRQKLETFLTNTGGHSHLQQKLSFVRIKMNYCRRQQKLVCAYIASKEAGQERKSRPVDLRILKGRRKLNFRPKNDSARGPGARFSKKGDEYGRTRGGHRSQGSRDDDASNSNACSGDASNSDAFDSDALVGE